MEGEETFSLRESRRAAQWKNNGRKEPATTNALHLILREVTAGVAVEEEVEEEEVEGEEEVEMKVEAGVEGEGEAEEVEEGEGGKRRKYWKGRLCLQNQCRSLIFLLTRFQARVPVEAQNPTTMVMMRIPSVELLRPKQRV